MVFVVVDGCVFEIVGNLDVGDDGFVEVFVDFGGDVVVGDIVFDLEFVDVGVVM